MKVSETTLPGVLLFEPRKFGDTRGYFMETWREATYSEAGIDRPFVQDNISFSQYGVLRGLHYQLPLMQGKLVSCIRGEIFDVAVDIRKGSPHFGKWVGITLSENNNHQLYIPPGFAHGFCVTSNEALFSYKCTEYYDPVGDMGIQWNDPQIGIEWPLESPTTSDKDSKTAPLSEVASDRLPQY